jgi:hypothetical protein
MIKPIFDNPIYNLTDTTQLSEVVGEFEGVDNLTIGEYHSKEHKKVLLDNGKSLQAMGFKTVYLEYRPAFEPFIKAVKMGYRGSCGNPNIDYVIHNLAALNFHMACVDPEDIIVKGKSYRAEVQKSKSLSNEHYNVRVNSITAIKSHALKTGHFDPQTIDQLDTDISHCFKIGPKSLENLFSYLNINPAPNTYENQKKFKNLDQKWEDNRLAFSFLFDAARNKIIAQNFKKMRKPNEKSILYNGIAHISAEVGEIKGNETIQALLNDQGATTLTVKLCGGLPNQYYDSLSMKICDQEELMHLYTTNKLFAYQYGPFNPDLRDKLFYIDRYDDNDQSHEDILLHLPEQPFKYIYE